MPLLLALLLLLLLPATVFADSSLYRSDDGGRSWAPLEGAPPVQSVFDLLLDPAAPGHLLLATEQSVWTSPDDGATWTQVPFTDGAVFALTPDPDNPARLWAASERGVWRSDDAGASWRPAGDVTPVVVALAATRGGGKLRLIGGGGEGVTVSDDEGGHWTPDSAGLEGAVTAVGVTPENDVLVGTTNGLYARAETETDFTSVRGLPRGGARSIYVAPDGTTYAAVVGNLYRRENGWVKLTTLPLSVNGDSPAIEAILRIDDRVLAGSDHALHSSENGWKPVPPFDQLAYLETATLAQDPRQPEQVWVGASTVPNSIAHARVGVLPNSASVETPDERLTIALTLVFLVGGLLIVFYMRRLSRQESSPPT
jgi:photosystem II stability/assembly factor-like uncharacterized protein